MAKQVQSDWNKLVRLARHLKGAPRLVWEYCWQAGDEDIAPVASVTAIGPEIDKPAKARVAVS